MARVKNGATTKARHKKVLKQAKGYFGSKHRLYKSAKEQLMHSGRYAFRDRKQRKRDMRKLWITRINAACRENNISYSRFIEGLNKAGVLVNRKMLSEIAINDPKAFTELVNTSIKGREGKVKVSEAKDINEVTVSKDKAKPVAKKETVKKEVKSVKEENKEKTEKKTAKKETKTDYNSMTLAELKNIAKEKEIKGYSTMKKAELVAALEK